MKTSSELGPIVPTPDNKSGKINFTLAIESLKELQYKFEDIRQVYLSIKQKNKKLYEEIQREFNKKKRDFRAKENEKVTELEKAAKESQKISQGDKVKKRKGRKGMPKVFVSEDESDVSVDEGPDENELYFK